MVRVLRQRTRRVTIEGLGIEQRFDQPFFVQIDHRPGDTAEAEAGGNAVTAHFIFKEASYCQRGAAGTGLQRETLFKVTGVLNDFRRLAGDQQLARVAGQTDGTRGNFLRIADFIYLDYQIHLILGNTGRIVRIIHPLFGEQHHAFSVLGIDARVAQRTAA